MEGIFAKVSSLFLFTKQLWKTFFAALKSTTEKMHSFLPQWMRACAWRDAAWRERAWRERAWRERPWRERVWIERAWRDASWRDVAWRYVAWIERSWRERAWREMAWRDADWRERASRCGLEDVVLKNYDPERCVIRRYNSKRNNEGQKRKVV